MYRNAKMRRKYGFGVALCLGICLYKMDWLYPYAFLCVGDMIELLSISVLNAFALGKSWFQNP